MSDKRKILFFIPQLVGGGAERVTLNIIKLLDKNIFDIHLVVTTLNGSVYEELPDMITLHNLNVKKTLFSPIKLRKLILKLSPNIVYSSLLRGHIAINISLFGITKKPYIVLRSPNSPKLLLENNQMSLFQRFLLENSYKRANLILAQTPEMKEEISLLHHINSGKIHVLLNPIDIDNINKKIKNINNPFCENNINVIAAGRITYQKGFDVLIKSFSKIIKNNDKYMLYIIGNEEGNEIENLKLLINDLNLFKHIKFLGYQTNPYKYFYFSDLYVLSSRWEGLPNTVLENLYLNKPIVATKCIPYMDSLINNGKNGILVDVENIEQLSNAILNYRDIVMSSSSSSVNNSQENVNCFFKNLKV